MDRATVLRDVRQVLEEHLRIADVDEATHLFRDLELDSIQQLTLVVEIENHFKICFDEGDEGGHRNHLVTSWTRYRIGSIPK